MKAPKKNDFWKLRADMTEDGRKLSVKQVIEGLEKYIHRCTTESLYEIDFVGQRAVEVKKPKMICMTIYGACVQLGITHETWLQWRKDKRYSVVLKEAENIFKSWNLEGSSAGFLNHSIISRIEGLKEKTDVTSNDKELQGLTIKWGKDNIDI